MVQYVSSSLDHKKNLTHYSITLLILLNTYICIYGKCICEQYIMYHKIVEWYDHLSLLVQSVGTINN